VIWSPLASGILTGKYDDGIPIYSRAALKVLNAVMWFMFLYVWHLVVCVLTGQLRPLSRYLVTRLSMFNILWSVYSLASWGRSQGTWLHAPPCSTSCGLYTHWPAEAALKVLGYMPLHVQQLVVCVLTGQLRPLSRYLVTCPSMFNNSWSVYSQASWGHSQGTWLHASLCSTTCGLCTHWPAEATLKVLGYTPLHVQQLVVCVLTGQLRRSQGTWLHAPLCSTTCGLCTHWPAEATLKVLGYTPLYVQHLVVCVLTGQLRLLSRYLVTRPSMFNILWSVYSLANCGCSQGTSLHAPPCSTSCGLCTHWPTVAALKVLRYTPLHVQHLVVCVLTGQLRLLSRYLVTRPSMFNNLWSVYSLASWGRSQGTWLHAPLCSTTCGLCTHWPAEAALKVLGYTPLHVQHLVVCVLTGQLRPLSRYLVTCPSMFNNSLSVYSLASWGRSQGTWLHAPPCSTSCGLCTHWPAEAALKVLGYMPLHVQQLMVCVLTGQLRPLPRYLVTRPSMFNILWSVYSLASWGALKVLGYMPLYFQQLMVCVLTGQLRPLSRYLVTRPSMFNILWSVYSLASWGRSQGSWLHFSVCLTLYWDQWHNMHLVHSTFGEGLTILYIVHSLVKTICGMGKTWQFWGLGAKIL